MTITQLTEQVLASTTDESWSPWTGRHQGRPAHALPLGPVDSTSAPSPRVQTSHSGDPRPGSAFATCYNAPGSPPGDSRAAFPTMAPCCKRSPVWRVHVEHSDVLLSLLR